MKLVKYLDNEDNVLLTMSIEAIPKLPRKLEKKLFTLVSCKYLRTFISFYI